MRSCLVCDDHALMREALCGQIALAWPEAQLHAASDFEQAWALAAAKRPDLVLCDLAMPGADPAAGVAGVIEAAPGARIVVVTGGEDDVLLIALFELGVDGFIPKSVTGELLEAAVRLVMAGGQYLPPRMFDLASARRHGGEVGNGRAESLHITGRKIEVLRAIAEGYSNKEIALALGLSPTTVKTHAAAIIAALGARNRTEAATKARALGLI